MNINFNKQSGFTLMELMIVLGIVGTLATLAVPSYRSYTNGNREHQARSDMLKIEGELERWRAKSLTYAGFVPSSGYTTGNKVESPMSSDTKRYNILVYSYIDNNGALTAENIESATVGLNWAIVATPINNNTGLSSYLLTNNGLRCSTPKKQDLDVTGAGLNTLISSRKCGIQSGEWL